MPKKIPMRQCVGCREMKEKPALVRVVKKDSEISLDVTGKQAGRGAYLCKKSACLKRAQKSRALERGFSAQIPPEIYEALEEAIIALEGGVPSE